ncbi:MAG: FAD-dependent oxidoreductase, partial [Rhizobiales bacterium]|nr:FAD-dependent oxidoreductase [Hyphomicrobiales bacterium]
MIASSVPITTDIVLVGGGHSHVEVLRRFAMQPQPGVRLTMIARDVDTPYSGMVPGYFAGHYTREDCHIDLRPLCIAAGARLYHASASGIDPRAQTVEVEGRPPVPYDFLSIDIGSVPDSSILPGAGAHTIPVKPIDRLLASVAGIEAEFERNREAMRIAVIGAGAGGIELTLALHHRLTAGGVAPEFIVLDAAPVILPTHASGARRAIGRTLMARGIEVRLNAPVASVEADRLVLDSGETVAFDHAILVSGASAAPWLAASGLSLDARGFVRIDGTLRSVSHPAIFAAGDIASFDQRPLAKSGVYAVKQGPVLAKNLRRAALGQALVRFRPQRHALALIATGPKHAVASRGPFALSGRYLWNLKDRIDRRFMEKYADLPPMRTLESARDEDPFAEMRCGGCGAKIGRDVLARVLARISGFSGA